VHDTALIHAGGGASICIAAARTHREGIVGKAAQIAAVIVMLALTGSTSLEAAEEESASGFVSLKLEGACDAQNNRLWLTNSHTFKTVATTVRWRAAGGKDLTDQFYPSPNSVREIGCAAEAEIVEAKFADF
jgi:hypothetical protein